MQGTGDNGIFTIQVRKCKRCGRLLTSREAVEKGYGCQCMRKQIEEERAREPLPGQIDLFGLAEEKSDVQEIRKGL